MSEEPPKSSDDDENEARNDPIDLNKRGQYLVTISGGSVAIPINQQIAELPVSLVEKFIEAGREQVPTAAQQAWRIVLAKHLGEDIFPGIADGDLDPDSITIEPAPNETD